jgi:uncharacterized protein YndB with AHSA1/START domain
MEIKMITNEKIITINRPVEEVFAYVSDLPSGPEWQPGLVEVRRITAGPNGVGTQFSGVRKFMGRKMESVIEYTTYEPNKKLVFKSISGNSPLVQSFLFEPTAAGTKLTARLELQTSSLMGLAKPLIASSLKRDVDTNYDILKNLLENQTIPVAA